MASLQLEPSLTENSATGKQITFLCHSSDDSFQSLSDPPVLPAGSKLLSLQFWFRFESLLNGMGGCPLAVGNLAQTSKWPSFILFWSWLENEHPCDCAAFGGETHADCSDSYCFQRIPQWRRFFESPSLAALLSPLLWLSYWDLTEAVLNCSYQLVLVRISFASFRWAVTMPSNCGGCLTATWSSILIAATIWNSANSESAANSA